MASPFNIPVSERTLRAQVARATIARLEEIVVTAGAQIGGQLEAFARLQAGAEPDHIGAVAAAMLHAMAGGAADVHLSRNLARIGTQRGEEGFPLHELLRAVDLTAGVVWDCALAELQASNAEISMLGEASMQMSVALLEASSRISGVLSESFIKSEAEFRNTGEHLRRDVFRELLEGSTLGLQALRDRAERAGYSLGDAHAVLIAELEGPSPDLAHETLRRLAAVLRCSSFGVGSPVVHLDGTRAIAIIPAPAGTTDSAMHARTQAALAGFIVPAGVAVLGAMGRVENAMPGIPSSHRQACRALEAAHTTGVQTGIVSYAEMLPALLLLQDPRLALDTFRATIEPLHVHDAQHGTELVSTLGAFLEERGVLAATAKRLYVHRHTLAPRLERIETVCGLSLRDRGDLLMLELGLQAQSLLHDSATKPVVGRPMPAPAPLRALG